MYLQYKVQVTEPRQIDFSPTDLEMWVGENEEIDGVMYKQVITELKYKDDTRFITDRKIHRLPLSILMPMVTSYDLETNSPIINTPMLNIFLKTNYQLEIIE